MKKIVIIKTFIHCVCAVRRKTHFLSFVDMLLFSSRIKFLYKSKSMQCVVDDSGYVFESEKYKLFLMGLCFTGLCYEILVIV